MTPTFNPFCTSRLRYPGMNFGQFVCKAYGEGKTSRPADVTDLCYQIVSGGGRIKPCIANPLLSKAGYSLPASITLAGPGGVFRPPPPGEYLR